MAVVGSGGEVRGNRLDLAVPPKSTIRKLADVKGRRLTCTTPVSITGYRAAVAMLMQEAGLRPNVDYSIDFSLGQRSSIERLAAGELEVAALSDDKLQSMIEAGEVEEADIRVIYQSEPIPRFTIGYVHNLDPDLAAKVTEAMLNFENKGGPLEEGQQSPARFIAVDYRDQFEFVRKIDESFDPRLVPETPLVEATAQASAEPSQN